MFEKGIEYFNSGYFFEAHDIFEEIWMDDREESKVFYQGLVQLATGYYHFIMRNLNGTQSQLNKGITKLSKYKPIYQDIHVSELIERVESFLNVINGKSVEELDYSEMITKIPKLKREGNVNHKNGESAS